MHAAASVYDEVSLVSLQQALSVIALKATLSVLPFARVMSEAVSLEQPKALFSSLPVFSKARIHSSLFHYC